MRKHYMTICFKENTEVTLMPKVGYLEVTFECAVNGGFKTLVLMDNGVEISNVGFNSSEVDYFRRFTLRHRQLMIDDVKGVL